MSLRVACCVGLTFVLGWAVGSGHVSELFPASHSSAMADDRPNRDDQPVDPEGIYTGETATYTIRKLGDGVYSYTEDQGNAGVWEGIGIYKDGILAFGWDKTTGGNLGISHIRVTRGEDGHPELEAYWTNQGSEEYVAYEPMPEYVGPVRNGR